MSCAEEGNDKFWIIHFYPDYVYKDNLQVEIDTANADKQALVNSYLRWIEGVLRVKFLYAKLLDEFLHIRHSFLDKC